MADVFISKINAGNVDYTIKDANAKTKQTAKTYPTAGSTATSSFIATITQDANGEITATKQPVGNLAAGVITSGTLGVARGGTGASSFTAGKVIVSNASSTTGALTTSSISTTELGYLANATGNIQEQIDQLSGGQSGGTDHIRFLKVNVTSSTTTLSGVGMISGTTTNWTGVVDGKTIKVGDIVIGKNYGLAHVTDITTATTMVNLTVTYLGIFATDAGTFSYDSTNLKLTWPSSYGLVFTPASS